MARHVVEMIKNRPASDLEINVVQSVFIASEDVKSKYFMCAHSKCYEKLANQHDTSARTIKEKILDRNRNYDLANTGRTLHLLTYENSWRARSFY